jgi:hypothetical protein
MTIVAQSTKLLLENKTKFHIKLQKLRERHKKFQDFLEGIRKLLNEKQFDIAKSQINEFNKNHYNEDKLYKFNSLDEGEIELFDGDYNNFIYEYIDANNIEVLKWFLSEMNELVPNSLFISICRNQDIHFEIAKLFAEICPERFTIETKEVITKANDRVVGKIQIGYFPNK